MRRPNAADVVHAAILIAACLIAGQTAPSVHETLAPAAGESEELSRIARQLGSAYATLSTDHFTLVHSADPSWARSTGDLLEKTHANFYRTFESAGFAPAPTPDKLVWVCFRGRDAFDNYALKADRTDMSWSKGYYSTRTNRVALLQRGAAGSLDIANATHEAAHQLAFNSGLQTRGVMYPLWASEGMAANFEANDAARFALGGDNSSRRRELIEACEDGRLHDLDDFITLTRLPFGNQQLIHDVYAQAWGFFRFLITERHAELKRYLAALSRLEPGRRDNATLRAEFTLAFGPVAGLEKDWQSYLRNLSR